MLAADTLPSPPTRGLSLRAVAARYRVARATVAHWIKTRQLRAVNVARSLCAPARWRIMPEALAEFERHRDAAPAPKPARRRKPVTEIDFFPDL
jgi:hypothetical protein